MFLQEKVPLAWVNQALFDYKGTLRSGTVTLPCWIVNPEEPLEELLNPIGRNRLPPSYVVYTLSAGTVLLNPNTQDSPSIMIRHKEFSDKPVVFPKLGAILDVASKEMESVSSNLICTYVKLLVVPL